MSVSPRAFKIGLYEEHLEEIAFLRGQCRAMRRAPHRGWVEPDPFERRLEAHLDALVVGGGLALEVCKARAADADADETFAIVALLCRQQALQVLSSVLESERLGDAGYLAAIDEALVTEWPLAWQAACVRGLGQGDPRLAPTMAAVAAHKGWPTRGQLAAALSRATPAVRLRLFEAIGHVDDGTPVSPPRDFYADPDAALRLAALRAGLRLHDERALAATSSDAPELLALVASREAAAPLLERLRGDAASPSVPQALGLIGELSSVRALVQALASESLAQSAAQALHLVTGADLRQRVLVPEAVDEAELTDAEVQRWRTQGQAPVRLDGEAFGERIDRLSQDPEAWGQWLRDNAGRFSAGLRYRLGRPCTARQMLMSLDDATLPAACRPALADELMTRHGLSAFLRTDLPVARQQAALRRRLADAPVASDPGRWVRFGRPLV